MSPDVSSPWPEILRAAMAAALEERREPVVGARFRHFVARTAAERGQTFPPRGDGKFRFVEFLQEYPEVLTVHRRQGEDLVVVPVNEPELLIETPRDVAPSIRSDFFTAFTRLWTDRKAAYFPDRDRIEWLDPSQTLSAGSVAIPRATIADAVELRRSFAAACPDDVVGSRLRAALDAEQSLSEFGNAVRAAKLQRAWHIHRSKDLTERIKRWADEAGVQWKDSWLTSSVSQQLASPENADGPIELSRMAARHSFINFLHALDDSELARISVPLDLVLKLIAGRR